MYIYQIIQSYILNIHNFCQLYLLRLEKAKEFLYSRFFYKDRNRGRQALAQGQVWPTAWVYKGLLELCIYTSFMAAFMLYRVEHDRNHMTGKVENICYSALYKNGLLTLHNRGLFFCIPQDCSVSSSHKDRDSWWLHHLDHWGLVVQGRVDQRISHWGLNLSPRCRMLLLLSLHWQKLVTPAPVPRWPEECPPMCPGGEQHWWGPQSL